VTKPRRVDLLVETGAAEHYNSLARTPVPPEENLKPRTLVLLLSLVLVPQLFAEAPPAASRPLRLDEIFSEEGLVTRGVENALWSPDGRRLAYILRDATGEGGELRFVDAATGETGLLAAREKLEFLSRPADTSSRGEREKERRSRFHVPSFLWTPDSKGILFAGGELHLFDLASGSARRLAADGPADEPKISPDGKWVAFLREHDLWLAPTSGGASRRLTEGGSETLLHGELDWVYPEELDLRSGWSWSPDSTRIAFLELDESKVLTTPIVDSLVIPATTQLQRYPKVGTPNPKARLGVVDILHGGAPLWIETPAEFEYLPRFSWIDAKSLAVQYLDRRQQRLDLQTIAIPEGRRTTLLSETDPQWVDLADDFTPLPKGEFLWSSERDGRRHLFVHDSKGQLLRRLTEGKWTVSQVVGVDTKGGWVWFLSSEKSPIESHLARVPIAGGKIERMTTDDASHSIRMNEGAWGALDVSSSWNRPPVWSILSWPRSGPRRFRFHESKLASGIVPPRLENLEIPLPDGALARGALLLPKRIDPAAKIPLLLYVYGGPQAPVVRNGWGGARELWHWMMTERGFAVLRLDDRTSSLPGHLFEVETKGRFGEIPLADHKAALAWIFERFPFLDRSRVGLWGWSGGGYTTAYDMFRAPELFRAGAAVAGLYDFRSYDTIWTERYMGLLPEAEKSYEASSAITHAAGLAGRLLVVHGDADDNVHVQNAMMLADALVRAGKPFDFAIYPRKTHGLAGTATRKHLYARLTEHFERWLGVSPSAP
jgi:dipeptidyl-peptidase-4